MAAPIFELCPVMLAVRRRLILPNVGLKLVRPGAELHIRHPLEHTTRLTWCMAQWKHALLLHRSSSGFGRTNGSGLLAH